MNDLGELRRENRVLRDRFLRLSSTVLRINSSLDLDTVLQEVVDSARALTGAAQGVITTVEAGGGLADFVTPGLSDEEVEALVETSPVGVVVLEAGSGRVASVNREARRIVEEIRTPDSPPEELPRLFRKRVGLRGDTGPGVAGFGGRGREVGFRDLRPRGARAREFRHSSPFHPLSRHGPAKSGTTAGNADRAIL